MATFPHTGERFLLMDYKRAFVPWDLSDSLTRAWRQKASGFVLCDQCFDYKGILMAQKGVP